MSTLKTLVCSLIIKIVGTTVHRLTFQLKNFYDDSLYYFDLDETVLSDISAMLFIRITFRI